MCKVIMHSNILRGVSVTILRLELTKTQDKNIHKRCREYIPSLCGRDHKEKRGRLKIKTVFIDKLLRITGKIIEFYIFTASKTPQTRANPSSLNHKSC